MELKIKITTPKGQAKATEKRLRFFILNKKDIHRVWTNEEDNEIYWEVHCDVRRAMKIQRNVAAYEHMIETVMHHKQFKKHGEKRLSKEDQAELKDMLENQTTIEIIKTATAEELVDEKNRKTFWQRIKETFKGEKPE